MNRGMELRPDLSSAACRTGRERAALDAFKKVRVAYDTVEWENGLDLDPEYLYRESRAT